MADNVLEAFQIVCEYLISLGYKNASEVDGCIEHQIDEHWWIALNGHKQTTTMRKNRIDLLPCTVYIEFNGWPAGIMTPVFGQIAAGEAANEHTFIQAIKTAMGQHRIAADREAKPTLGQEIDKFDDEQFKKNGGMPYGTYGGY